MGYDFEKSHNEEAIEMRGQDVWDEVTDVSFRRDPESLRDIGSLRDRIEELGVRGEVLANPATKRYLERIMDRNLDKHDGQTLRLEESDKGISVFRDVLHDRTGECSALHISAGKDGNLLAEEDYLKREVYDGKEAYYTYYVDTTEVGTFSNSDGVWIEEKEVYKSQSRTAEYAKENLHAGRAGDLKKLSESAELRRHTYDAEGLEIGLEISESKVHNGAVEDVDGAILGDSLGGGGGLNIGRVSKGLHTFDADQRLKFYGDDWHISLRRKEDDKRLADGWETVYDDRGVGRTYELKNVVLDMQHGRKDLVWSGGSRTSLEYYRVEKES